MNKNRFQEISSSLQELSSVLGELIQHVEKHGVAAPNGEQWHELLYRKLIPQLVKKQFLVVSVVGGTNTGKSVVFNHIVGENASAADHRAAGTKHPVCLLAAEKENEAEETPEQILSRHFSEFSLLSWVSPSDPLLETDENCLFWRFGENVRQNLLILDTPDIDSDAAVNWQRAGDIRQAADVLVAVLTSQKYNDAAVKRFFRDAAQADKPVIVVFNFCELFAGENGDEEDSDIPHISRWVEQFTEETGVHPIAVYVAPFDKKAADSNSLPFYVFTPKSVWTAAAPAPYAPVVAGFPCLPSGISNELEYKWTKESVLLSSVLSGLHFEDIKARALQGALRVLCDGEKGVGSFLKRIQDTAKLFEDAKKTLSCNDEAQIEWPGLPNAILVDEIRFWWHKNRPSWVQGVHGTYRKIGEGILWPVRKAWDFAEKSLRSPESYQELKHKQSLEKPSFSSEEYKKDEFNSVMLLVEKTIERLEKMSRTDNPILRKELTELLSGDHRKALIEQARAAHKEMQPISDEFRAFLQSRLDDWCNQNPGALSIAKSVDKISAVARPVLTLSLGLGGFTLAGGFVAYAVSDALFAGGVTALGESVLHKSGESAMRSFSELFRSFQLEYAKKRAGQFTACFAETLWSDLTKRLSEGENLDNLAEFQRTVDIVKQLKSQARLPLESFITV